jgi:NADPH:quinone reductase-like Zn-dependent oxidoreductase
MNRAVTESKLKPVIDKIFAFDQVPEALKYFQSGSHFGKIVVQIKR